MNFDLYELLAVSSSNKSASLFPVFKESETQDGEITCPRLFSEWVESMSVGQ